MDNEDVAEHVGAEEGEEADEELDWAAEVAGQKLLSAAFDGSIDEVVRLLDQGVDVNFRGDDEWTAVIVSSHRGRTSVVSLLCERGADVNLESAEGNTALNGAAYEGHLEIVQLLHARGVDLHHEDMSGLTPCIFASLYDRLPVCEFLLGKGANLLAVANDGRTALGEYGLWAKPPLSPAIKALRCAALEAAWAAGPHPSQVQRRRDERWARRGPLLWVLAEHAYRPLQVRALAIALAAAELDPAAPIEAVALTTKEQRHAFLLGRVFSHEGIVRILVNATVMS